MMNRIIGTHRFNIFLIMLLVLMGFNVHANNLKIHVLDASKSQPLKNAAVCLGTATELALFGAMRTNANGDVTFSHLPKAPVLVTVSSSQRKGVQRTIPLQNVDIDLVRIIQLPLGGLGPVCNAPLSVTTYSPDLSTSPAANNHLKITGFHLDRGRNNTNSRTVVLNSKILGKPTHYRMSEHPDFKGSNWQDYKKTPLFTLSKGYGQKQVYYQVRKSIETHGGTLQKNSNIMSDLITLKPQQ